ncbi:DNRLRE domain-containing protein [Microbispora sp. NEAU-D428]|uniref:DNRLRE domain-containing protein n=1 Tax=Microbispora sitophila TaxID=2771537 RepID=UPI0018688C06|nr:DNRLRE domain-containing protein [Microbispora sitophila]MBE3013090.1 DNRLRE domain-containing protein [Microbispora sitophila]
MPISRARKLLPSTVHGRFSRAWIGAVVALGVFVAGIGVPDGLVTPASAATETQTQQERSVEGRPVAAPTPHVKAEEASHLAKKPPAPVWPKSGSARVDVVAGKASAVPGLPVAVAAADAAGATPGSSPSASPSPAPSPMSKKWVSGWDEKSPKAEASQEPVMESPASVMVKTFDNTVARKVGGVGMVLQLTRADGGTSSAAAKVTVDYSSFRGAGGGGFASRLTLVRLPACVLAQPLTPECAKQRAAQLRVLPVVNDVKTGHLTAEVEVAPAADGTTPGAGNSAGGSGAQATPTTATTASAKASLASPAAASGGTADAFVYVVAASAAATAQGSMAGDFSASPLKPSGTWQAGQAGGAFTYSYPITAPPAPSGDAPKLALQYSSAAVDSLTSQTNNQSGIAGMGWELETGFIERSFVSCSGYAKSGRLGYNTAQVGWPDKCWQSPYSSDPGGSKLTLSVDGHSTDIVKDSSGKWRTVEDYGWKIEPMSEQSWWRITTQDGTVYRFGYNEDSSLTMSFIGDDEGEKCHEYYPAPGSGESTVEQVCEDTWRWMLDREVDPNGNVIDYSYTKEDGAYCSPAYDWDWDCAPEYDKAAHVREVDYGHNINVTGSTPTARIVFTTTGRASGNITDVPTWCEDGTPGYCLFNEGPSFYTTQKLSSITTQTLIPGSTDWTVPSSWEDVTRWNLSYQWLTGDIWNADKYPILWLDSIQQVGLAGGKGTQIALPPTTFDATFLDNAVSVGLDPVQFPRIGAVNNGLGGRSEVEYGQPHPCPNPWQYPPTDGWDTRGLDCYFVTTNQEIINGTWNYYGEVYAKWLVMSVTDIDLVGGSPEQVTSYSYGGDPAWAVPDNPLAVRQPFRRNDYTEWRGYGQVTTTVGDGLSGSGVSTTSAKFFRGMSGQNLTDFDGNSYPDRIELNGRTLQEQARDNNGENSSTRYEYAVTVTGTAPGTRKPSRVDQTRKVAREKTTTGWRYTETKTTYNSDGLPTKVNDYGDTSTASDNTCTATTYARNTTNWLIDYEASKEEHAGDDCTAGDLLSRTVYLYDGANDPAANTPTRGNVTETRAYSTNTDYVRSLSTFDNYGRPITTTEPISNTADPEEIKTTTITYDPAIGWPKDGVKVKNPLGHEVKTWSSQYNGQPVGKKDANGNAVNIDYDVLGRTLQLWTPEAPKPADDDLDHSDNPPAAKVTYTVTSGQPPRTAVARLQSGARTNTATYTSTYTYSDGFGRQREVQTASPAGGRIVQVTTYDGRGLTAATSTPVHNGSAPGLGLLNPAWDTVPQWSKPVYDGLGRVTAQVDMNGSTEFRRTTANYLGADKYEVIPPVGGKTVYYTDAADQVTKIEEWLSGTGTAQQSAAVAGPTPPTSSKTSSAAAAAEAEQDGAAEPQTVSAAPTADAAAAELQAARTRAAAEAKKSGKPVEVSELTDESSITYAQPDGKTFTTQVGSGPVRTRRGDDWVPIDTTLTEQNGTLTPKAITGGATVEVSTGGEGAFVTMTARGQKYALSWPTPLPKPTVSGNVATFPDAAGKGADLVVTVLATGFRHDVVLRERPTKPVEIRIGVQSKGLTLSEGADGRLLLKDGKDKKPVASAPQPVMWDAPPGSDGGQDATGKPGKIATDVVADDGEQTLVLRPDPAFLADPATRYPVTIDPTVTLPLTTDTTVISGQMANYSGDTTISAGYYGGTLSRALVKFDTSALTGATVSSATLQAYKNSVKTSACPRAGVRASQVTAAWDPATVTYANQPAYIDGTITLDTSGCAAKTNMSWTVTSIVQAWASGTPNYGVQLRGNVETSSADYRVLFDSSEAGTGRAPSLSVTYTINSAPTAGNLSITPVTGSAVSSLTPTLHATVSDPAGGNLRADYEVEHDPAYTAEGTGQIWAGSSATVTSGNDATVAVPAGKLTDGWHIRWRARATNTGTSVSSAWSAWQTATVNVPDPVVDQLQVTPSQDLSGEKVTSTLTPALAARVTTPDAAASRVEFELEHDLADTAHGTGQIWTTGADNIASGAQATVTVPTGKLADGWKVRWRARAVAAGSNTSAWSQWQSLTVKVPAATVSQLQITPAQTSGQTTTVTSLTPQLLATVTDAYGQPLRAEFELEHDPADTQHGTGQIWTTAVDNIASGTQASVTVPGGKLNNAWGIRWRVRAVNTATQVTSAWSDWQSATVDLGNVPSEPAVSALQVAPSQVIDGTTVTSSLTPQLLAQVTNPAGGTMRAEFEVEHDPADTEHGTGQIWTTAVDDVPAGTQATVTVPADTLSEGWLVRWRARAVAGEAASAWSDWQTVRVDQPDPVLGTLQATPSEVVGGKTISSSLTPQLLAQVTDPAGGKVRAEFELEHDPAAPQGQGNGQIWTTAVDDVTSGTQASVTVPDGKLSDGWLVRWRARAVTAGGTSAWSDWQQLTVTDGSLIPVVGNPRTRPANNGTTTTLTPALLATVSSDQGGQLGAEFEVEHDPADTQHGTGQIWTTSVSGVASGNDATVTIPAGAVSNGWRVRWHARAVKNGLASDWTAWQSVTVNVPNHYDTTYEYDRDGQLIKQTDANGNIRTFTYDLLGRRTASHDPDAGDSQQAYDAAGRLAWTTDGKGQKVSYSYDALGRTTTRWSGEAGTGTKTAEWAYDTAAEGIGRLTSATRYTNGHAYVTAVTGYDLMGRPTGSSITIPAVEGALAGTYTFTADYDTAGNLSQIGMPAKGGLPAETLTFTFTDLNLPQAVTSDLDGGTTYVSTTAYTQTARLANRRYGANGQINRTFAWDETTGRLTGVITKTKADTPTPVTVQDDVFSYNIDDTINNILDKAAATGGSSGQLECFTYDGLHRLTQAWTTTATSCGTGTAAADGLGIDPYSQSYAWDGVGNLTSLTSNGQTATYTYSPPGASAVRPDAVTSITRPNGTDSYGYDNAGQMTSRTIDGKQSTFTYDELGELTKAVVDGQTTDNVYDADGQRLIRRTPDGKTTLYLGSMELELSAGTVTGKRYYTTADGSQIAIRTPATLTWLLSGNAGSEQLAIDDTTQAARHERYLPFGQRRGDDDLPFTDRGFLGKIEDDSTGLTLLGARFYDPTIAKFLSPDPLLNLANPGLTNAYGYAGGDPANLSDPDGFEPRPWQASDWNEKSLKERRKILKKYWDGERRAQRESSRRQGENALRNDKKGLGDRASEQIRFRNQVGNTRHHQAVWDEACRKDFVCSNLKEMDATTKSRGAGSLADVVATGGGPGVGSGGFAGMGMVRSLGSNRGGRTVLPPPRLRSRPCSFVPGTKILMADGSLKPIEDVKAGDHLVATDPQTGKTEYHIVLEPLASDGPKSLVKLTTDTDGKRGNATGTVTATDNHPFWVQDVKAWVPAGELKPASWLRTSAGTYVKVVSLQHRVVSRQRVHNLSVEGIHAYYVLAGAVPVLVHNSGLCNEKIDEVFHNPSGRSSQDQFEYHWDKHAKGRGVTREQYLQDAQDWATGIAQPGGKRGLNASLETLADGTRGIKYVDPRTGKGGIIGPGGKAVTFWYGAD